MKYKAILLFGAPGSGKGTQGKILGMLPGFLHSSTGDLFRSLDRNSEMGKVFLQYSTRGELVPDEFTINLWKQHMQGLVSAGKFDPHANLVVMDGVPRNTHQAELLKDLIDVQKIIYLATDDMDAMVARLKARAMKENRSDDADEDIIRHRMEVYEKETAPLLSYYSSRKVTRIEANQSIFRVHHDVVKSLLKLKDRLDHESGEHPISESQLQAAVQSV